MVSVTHLLWKMDLSYEKKQSLFPQERGERSWNKYTKDTLEYQSASTEQDSVYTGQASTKTLNSLLKHALPVKDIDLRSQGNH